MIDAPFMWEEVEEIMSSIIADLGKVFHDVDEFEKRLVDN